MAEPASDVVTQPEPGQEICYECEGKRVCWSCGGKRIRSDGRTCTRCAGRGLCIVCNGAGQLPLGTAASLDS